MITQRLVADLGVMQGRLTIETIAQDANSLVELQSLHAELKLRANVHTEGSIITTPPAEDVPPDPPPME